MAICSSAAALLHLPIAPWSEIYPPEEVLLLLLEMSLEEGRHLFEMDSAQTALALFAGLARFVYWPWGGTVAPAPTSTIGSRLMSASTTTACVVGEAALKLFVLLSAGPC